MIMSKMFLITHTVLYKTWIEAESEEEALDIYDHADKDVSASLEMYIEEG